MQLHKAYKEDLERKMDQIAELRQEKNQIQANYDKLLIEKSASQDQIAQGSSQYIEKEIYAKLEQEYLQKS